MELADALGRELNVRAEFGQNDWSSLIPTLERGGSFDVAMNGMEITPARAGRVLFTRPYYLFQLRLMARRGDTSVTGLESLRGRRVGTHASAERADPCLSRAGAGRHGLSGPMPPCPEGLSLTPRSITLVSSALIPTGQRQRNCQAPSFKAEGRETWTSTSTS